MKKKIAVFANGWSKENLHEFLVGAMKVLPPESADLIVLLGHGSFGMSIEQRKVECMIYDIVDFSQFDGAIMYGSGMNFIEVIEDIKKRLAEANVPVVCMGKVDEDFTFVGVDNYDGMKTLCNHLIDEHNCKRCLYIGGAKEHGDSQIREKALRDALSEHGLSLADDDVFYSNWENGLAADFAAEKCKDIFNMPDAIVCANDYIAIYTSLRLGDMGISVPDDVIISGFDYIKESQIFYPSITSVDQHFDRLGIQCASMIMDMMEGKEVKKESYVNCEFMPGESCGCGHARNADKLRREYTRAIPKRNYDVTDKEGRLRAFERALLSSDNYSNLATCIQKAVYEGGGCEGDTFYIMLDPQIQELAWDPVEFMPRFEFPKIYDVMAAKYNGKPINIKKVKRNELIPGYKGEGRNRLYTVLPIYLDCTYFCGYTVFGDNVEYYSETFFWDFVERIKGALDSYKLNLKFCALNAKLTELMQTDALTAVRNRTAFENYKDEISAKIQRGATPSFAIGMFDVNNLKKINDEIGHEAGDRYIKNACEVICENFRHSTVFRIGGDEFLAIMSGADYENAEALIKNFREEMAKVSVENPDENRASVASGLAIYDPAVDESIDAVIKRADALMYDNKKLMKATK